MWIFTEGEGDGIESRLPFKTFYNLLATLVISVLWNIYQEEIIVYKYRDEMRFRESIAPFFVTVEDNPK